MDLLRDKGRTPVWIEPLSSVHDALDLMNQEDIGALLVEIDGYLVGIVSERDYVRKVILSHHASKKTRVSEIMTRDVITVTSETTLDSCLELMKAHNIRHLPVVEAGRSIGMISLKDLFLAAIESLKSRPAHNNVTILNQANST